MSAEKSPIKRESIELSLCYYEIKLAGDTPCPGAKKEVRRFRPAFPMSQGDSGA
jgi:hypothetical protein